MIPFQSNNFFSSKQRVRHGTLHQRRRGAALVEFALISVLFLTMLLGMLQFGIYLSATNTLWNGAREGARLAAVQSTSLPQATADAQIKDRIAKTIFPLDASKATITVTPAAIGSRTYGTPVTVRISYDMSAKLFIPLPSAWFGKGLGKTYVTYATMRKENDVLVGKTAPASAHLRHYVQGKANVTFFKSLAL